MKVLALILARGGSKGIPKKNIQKIGKNSLLELTISHAKKSKLINKILVSTDLQEIKIKALKNGAEAPFLRPKKISDKNATTFQVVKHAINYLEKTEQYVPDIIVILQPTTPFRSKGIIDLSITKLRKNDYTSIVSVCNVKMHPSILFSKKNKYLIPLDKNFEKHTIRQKREKMYYPNGSIYTFWTTNLKKFNSIYGPKIGSIIIKKEELNLDIDTLFDLFVANATLKNWKIFQKKSKLN
jgi:CMP-N-acetylneuraminic acid synthetase